MQTSKKLTFKVELDHMLYLSWYQSSFLFGLLVHALIEFELERGIRVGYRPVLVGEWTI